MEDTTVTCKRCNQELPAEAFYWTKWGTLSQGYCCKKCSNARDIERYQARKTAILQPPTTCRSCNRELPETEFVKNPSYKTGYTGRCRDCTKIRNFKPKDTLKWFREYKQTLSCEICGESEPCCLDFHHRDPKEKDGMIARMVQHMTVQQVQNEIAKCAVLCANCHRKLHAGILKSSMGEVSGTFLPLLTPTKQ